MMAHDPPPAAAASRDTAGAYGFRRRELIAIVVLAVVVGGITILQWWQEDQALAHRQWSVQDVYIDTLLLTNSERRAVADSVPAARPPEPSFTVVDVNTADERELMRIPGVGPALAERIVVSRAINGPFRSVDDLQRVHGIGVKTATRMARWIRFSGLSRITMDSAEGRP